MFDSGSIFGLVSGVAGLLGLLKIRLHLPGPRTQAVDNQLQHLANELAGCAERGYRPDQHIQEEITEVEEKARRIKDTIPETPSLLKEYSRFMRGYSWKPFLLGREIRRLRRKIQNASDKHFQNCSHDAVQSVVVTPGTGNTVAVPGGRVAAPSSGVVEQAGLILVTGTSQGSLSSHSARLPTSPIVTLRSPTRFSIDSEADLGNDFTLAGPAPTVFVRPTLRVQTQPNLGEGRLIVTSSEPLANDPSISSGIIVRFIASPPTPTRRALITIQLCVTT